jgi:membrane-associated phospholipid phosphatase
VTFRSRFARRFTAVLACVLALASLSPRLAHAVPTLDPLLAIDAASVSLAASDSLAPSAPSSVASGADAGDSTAVGAATAAPADSVREKPRNMFGMFLDDAWYIATSPTRMNVETVLWTTGIAAGTALLFAYDEDVLDFMRDQGDRPVYRTLLDVGEFIEPVGNMGNTNKYYAAALALGWTFKVKPVTTIFSEILESHIISGGIRNVLKFAVGRAHPFEGDDPYHFEPFSGHGTSFPSGHSSVIMELATIASMNARWWPVSVLSYGAASTLLLQRVDARAHWPSDILASAASGHIIARTIVEQHRRRAEEDKAKGRVGLVADPNGLRLVWQLPNH